MDAIVNAANNSLLGGGGVDGAIHFAAGSDLLTECEALNGCKTGDAKITKGYNLKARHVIHTVGPIWKMGRQDERKLLISCYKRCIDVAIENNIKTIAFPAISTGIYRFPVAIAAKIAMRETVKALQGHSTIEKVHFVCFDDKVYNEYMSLYDSL